MEYGGTAHNETVELVLLKKTIAPTAENLMIFF
jgi:hypothetical protein